MEFSHKPVLPEETIELLHIDPAGIYVDATAGGGGHSERIAKRLTTGRLIALDRDPDAVRAASNRLTGYPAAVIHANYSEIRSVLRKEQIAGVHGVLMDLGVSSFQLDNMDRGFSYQADAPLDMRMSKEGESAAELIARLSVEQLAEILRRYGEERYAGRIASAIVKARQTAPITTTGELANSIIGCVPASYRRQENPCRRSFQAIRIAVNGELAHLEKGLGEAFDVLLPGGVLAVISFHSLEDRVVKHRFVDFAKGCICPPDFPVCVCNQTPQGRLLTRKPITASQEEILENPRSRSAKLRAVQKITEDEMI